MSTIGRVAGPARPVAVAKPHVRPQAAVAPRRAQPQIQASPRRSPLSLVPGASQLLGGGLGALLGGLLGPVGMIGGGLVGGLLGGNLGILGLHKALAKHEPQPKIPAPVRGPYNQHVIDDKVWRGSAPRGAKTYEDLAKAGVTTIVDLRAERGLKIDEAALAKAGIKRVSLPIRDGQIPSREQVEAFLKTVRESQGKVYLHCGAGVGRTGSMAAAYMVETGQATPAEALQRNLSVGPPSLEQITYMNQYEKGEDRRPNPLLVAVSRVLDAPRRIWSRLKH